MLALLFLQTAQAEPPQQVEVVYTVSFDLGQLGDSACAATGICDCSVTYKGSGKLQTQADDKLVFEGTWKHTDGSCNDVFMLWTPANGAAYHHLTLDDAGVREWMVSKGATDKRLTSGMKAGGQFWITGMAAKVDGQSQSATHTEKESSNSGGLSITTSHRLQVTLAD